MAQAAIDIVRDPARWREMSELAATDARARFGRDEIVSRYEALYEETLAARRTPRVAHIAGR
jgi:hypothetical protein